MEWISVKERLPEPKERILAYCPNMTEADIGPVSVQWGWTCKQKRSDISHWMPLPESPNERRDREADVEEYEEMTIEAAIKHCEEVSRRSPCTPCEREHMRLAAWLTELVSLRAQHKQPVVVHGRWKPKRGNYITGGGNPLWCCSNCGYTVGASLLPPKSNYCPNCGAKMDGVCQEGDGHE